MNRLIPLVRRELGAEDVRVLEPGDDAPAGALEVALPDGKRIAAVFAAPLDAADRETKQRRLEVLIESFRDSLRLVTPSRPPPGESLHVELQGLAQRADAIDALVIDAQSPVVWGAAEDTEGAPHLLARDNVISLEARRDQTPPPPPTEPSLVTRAIDAVRTLPEMPSLHRGGHLHASVRDESFGWIARSFASIYVVVLVFDHPYDELRAERALASSLPVIERLVTALPPLDPSPTAGAAAIRRRRR
ncbi:MAG: hypothetical protein HYV09_35640 [Deltaproteobacteria bacterium]|nr:hypothetical protein [Deltaproteobacteria bacterium]